MKNKITISDVATKSGFSVATVSRALNSSGSVKAATKAKILAASKSLGFQFNELGRAMQKQDSQTIGVIVPTLQNPVFASAIEGVQKIAAQKNYQVIFSCVDYDEMKEEEAVNVFLSKKISAVILTVTNPNNSKAMKLLQKNKVPFCLMFNESTQKVNSVSVNNFLAAKELSDVLIKNGHKDIVFLAVNFHSSERSYLRYMGVIESYANHRLKKPKLIEVNYQKENLESVLSKALTKSKAISAIFASNDLLAMKCMKVLKKMGVKIPEDISVVGFDGLEISDLIEPSLTTIVTPNQKMGERAASKVLTLITKNKAGQQKEYLDYFIRKGDSLALKN